MKRIGLIWIDSNSQLKDELDGCLFNALKDVTAKQVVLCKDKETESLCNEQGIDVICLESVEDSIDELKIVNVENTHSQAQVIFERFNVDLYDEIVFIDGSMIGPFYDLKEMFDKMLESYTDADFWGLIRLAPMYTPKKEKLPENIDSRFMVLRKSVFKYLKSQEFYKSVYDIYNINELPLKIAFPYALELAGYKSAAYCNTQKYRNIRNCNNFIWYEGKSFELVKDERCPFVPSYIFSRKNFLADDGYDARHLIEYIKDELHFSQDYLWRKLLGSYNVGDIYQGLHLDYVLSEYHTDFDVKKKKAAVIIHIYYADLLSKIAKFILNLPEWVDIYITTSIDENTAAIEKCFSSLQITNYQVLKVLNRGRDCSALLVGCREIVENYEYLCFVHDKKTSGNNGTVSVGERFMDSLFENLLGSKEYIYNIMELFENNPHLGLAAPPIPVHGQYFCLKQDAWTCCFEETAKLAKRLGLSVRIDKDKPPFILSTSFWCRTKALEPLFKHGFTYEDFVAEPMPEDGTISHAIERILPYIAQTQGFYSAVIMTTKNASLQVSNLNYQLIGAMQRLKDDYSISSYSSFENFSLKEFAKFCHKYKRIYIYGTGLYGRKYAEILYNNGISYVGFVVTNNNGLDNVDSHPVYGYDEFEKIEKNNLQEVGIIVAVSVYYQEEISEMLEQKGPYNYYVV